MPDHAIIFRLWCLDLLTDLDVFIGARPEQTLTTVSVTAPLQGASHISGVLRPMAPPDLYHSSRTGRTAAPGSGHQTAGRSGTG